MCIFYKVRFEFSALGLCDRELFAVTVQMWKVEGNVENRDIATFFLARNWSIDLLSITECYSA